MNGASILSTAPCQARLQKGEDKFTVSGYAPFAYDVNEAARLWRDSLKLVGLPDDE